MEPISRRQASLSTLFGAGAVGLRALATGIPMAALLNPRKAMAAGAATATCADPTSAQFIVLATSGSGDPLNGNVPGTYMDPGIVHPPAQSMAATNLTLSGKTYQAAAPWATLGTNLDRTAFFHHGTYTVVHGDEQKTLTLAGAVKNNDMLVSMLASQLAPCLGTVQTQPICIGAQSGSEALMAQGRTLPILNPSSLASVLTLPNGPLANLKKLRDGTLDALNAYARSQGNTAQQAFIDRYANSQEQLLQVSDTLLNNLAAIKDNSPASQSLAAIVLFQMNVAPVVSVHFPFGGDNHGDNNLAGEAQQQVASLATINSLLAQLKSANLQDRVTFMALNVFGRTMAVSHKGTSGRDHNANHHCTVIIGKNVKGSVAGGVTPMGGDYGATGIDSATGASDQNGDIPFLETFAAMGKTVGRAVGIDETYLDANISGGKAVAGSLV